MLLDEEFEDEDIIKNPPLYIHPNGAREWLQTNALETAALLTRQPERDSKAFAIWHEMRMKASKITEHHPLKAAGLSDCDIEVLLHSVGGKVAIGKLFCHLMDEAGSKGNPTAFLGNAASAAADVTMHIPQWIGWKRGKWMNHHSANQHMQGEKCAEHEMSRAIWEMLTEEQREFLTFFEEAVNIAEARQKVRTTIERMFDDSSVELAWSLQDMREQLALKNIVHLCDDPRSLAQTFEKIMNVSLQANDMAPIRSFFRKIETEAVA